MTTDDLHDNIYLALVSDTPAAIYIRWQALEDCELIFLSDGEVLVDWYVVSLSGNVPRCNIAAAMRR